MQKHLLAALAACLLIAIAMPLKNAEAGITHYFGTDSEKAPNTAVQHLSEEYLVKGSLTAPASVRVVRLFDSTSAVYTYKFSNGKAAYGTQGSPSIKGTYKTVVSGGKATITAKFKSAGQSQNASFIITAKKIQTTFKYIFTVGGVAEPLKFTCTAKEGPG